MKPSKIYKIAYDLCYQSKINQKRNRLIGYLLCSYLTENFKDSQESEKSLEMINYIEKNPDIEFNENLLTEEIREVTMKIIDSNGEYYVKLKNDDLQEEFYGNVRTIKNILMYFFIISIIALILLIINLLQ